MSTLYVEPSAGLAGDMFLGALAGLCQAHGELPGLPARLGLHDARVEVREVEKRGIACRQVKVVDLNQGAGDREQGAGDTEQGAGSREQGAGGRGQGAGDSTAHGPSSTGHGHAHASPSALGSSHAPHRHLADILALIDGADLPTGAKDRAKRIFRLIGEAESEVHGIPVERIHFHEISAVDSIVDIVGSAWLLDRLGVERCFSEPVCTGFGTARMAHGEMPLPAPATALLLRGMPSYKGDERGERTTPTGAAILRSLEPDFDPPPLRVGRLAYGPGEKDFRAANVLRLSLADPLRRARDWHAPAAERVEVVETDLDDCTGEALGSFFQEGLLAAGALDFTLTQTIMKKGRPGIRLGALVPRDKLDAVADYILENTSAIGLRIHSATRRILPRREVELDTAYGPVKGKEADTPSGARRSKPDHAEWERLRRSGQ
jgi:uncharacterized protein (TIGR00299 family) protein